MAGVDGAIVEPLDVNIAGKGNILDTCKGTDPVEPIPLLRPETLRIVEGAFVFLKIGSLVDPGRCLQGFRHRVGLALRHGVIAFQNSTAITTCLTVMNGVKGEPIL
jgi:hypothetical protein